jgi:hypothetical protein
VIVVLTAMLVAPFAGVGVPTAGGVLTRKSLLVPVCAPAEFVAVMWNVPELLIVTLVDSAPETKAPLVPPPAESVPFDVMFTVPVKPVAVLLFASSAVMWMVNAVPGFCVGIVPSVLELTVKLATGPGLPVALNVVVSAPAVAVRVLEPTTVPSVQLPTVAKPLASVVCVPPVTLPPPDATAKVTLTPDFGLPFASVMRTLGAVATADPAVAD